MKFRSVHRLIARAFIPNPHNKPQVNHKNGIKTDNRIENLEWMTVSENTRHSYKNGLQIPKRGENHSWSKLTKDDVLDIIATYATGWFSQREIAEAYGMKQASISDIVIGKNWAHL